jgi:hypothetical protein
MVDENNVLGKTGVRGNTVAVNTHQSLLPDTSIYIKTHNKIFKNKLCQYKNRLPKNAP